MEFSITGTVKPHANASLDATVDVSVLGFGIGVECDVTLIDVEVPLKGEAKVVGSLEKAYIDFGLSLDASLGTLGGKLSFYVEALGVHVFDLALADWPSVTHTWNIFRTPDAKIHFPDLIAPFDPAMVK
jgi:hypothetical protein